MSKVENEDPKIYRTYRKKRKMAEEWPFLSVITLNVNGFNFQIKKIFNQLNINYLQSNQN